jgi:ABC-type antimicrobial peptide transport system permease subunit
MKKLLISLVAFSLLILTPTATVAQVGVDCSDGKYAQTQFCKDQPGTQTATDNDIIGTLQIVVELLTLVVGVAAVFGIVIGGFQIATSGGNSESVSKGRKTVIYSAVGLAITILARTIIVFVLGRI